MASDRISKIAKNSEMGNKLCNYYDFISWARWYPDLLLDIMKPEKGGINLSLDQRIFMRCDVRFFSMYGDFSRGYAKCIAGDSLIYTDKGVKEIGEFFNYQNDGIETHYNTTENVVNRYGTLEKTRLGLYNGKQKCKKITTSEGYSLTGTHIHRVLCMKPDGNIDWVMTKDIKVGDYVVINRKNDVWGSDISLEDVAKSLKSFCGNISKQKLSHLNVRQMPLELNDDIALLCGYLIGDGCLTVDNSILFSNVGDSILDNYKRIMLQQFGIKNVIKRNKDAYDYIVNDAYLRKFFEYFGLGYEKSYNKCVPYRIMTAPKHIVRSFLRGLFDTDGTVDARTTSLTSVSKRLIAQVQSLLLNFGIISYVYKAKTKSKFGVAYTLVISGNEVEKFLNNIGFGLEYKQEKLIQLSQKNHNTNKDVIPYQHNNVIKLIDESKIGKSEYGHVYSKECNLTYSKLKSLISKCDIPTKEYEHLSDIYNLNYYYAKVKSIEDVVTDVYDFHLPETHSFVSNGFVSHNTYTEVLDCIVTAMLFPNVTLAISAQTKENAADLLSAKWNEITKHFPLILNEVDGKPKFSKGTSWIRFKNGSEIDAIANSQSTKGQRRTRIKIEESALLNNALFEDALAPVVEVPRLTVGKIGMVDPCELNQQIHFFTTAGFKGSDEHSRLITMIDDMENLKGKIVLGSNWMLPCWYGRGSSKSQILQKKKDMSVVSFAQNYEQEWVGASEGALININKLLDCRTMPNLTLKPKEDEEYYLGVDVARSQKTSNNQSSIVVGRVKRNANRTKILSVDIVNVINIPNILNFNAQAAKVKRVQKQYNAKAVIIDGNGLGAGLVDALLTETICPVTGESLGCWDTMNDTNVCEVPNSPKIVYNLKAQSCQNEIITTFIDYVESKRLRLYERKIDNTFTEKEWDDFENSIRPYMETDAFIEEAANLRMKHLPSGSITIEKVVKKIDKDRVSALIYMLWYVDKFVRDVSVNTEYETHVFVN